MTDTITLYAPGGDTPDTPKAVAARLRELAPYLPDSCATPWTDRAEIVLGRLRIKCVHSRAAVENVAARYERGLPRGLTFTAPSARRIGQVNRPTMDAFLRFWEDGERDNALAYLQQWPQDVWPGAAVELLREEGFTWN